MAKLSTTSVFGDLLVDGMIHGNVTGNLTGNASTATSATTASKADILTTARNIALGGLLSGSASFNGSANITINASIAKPPKSGDWFSGGITTVGTDGVMEIGKYIDFHNTDASTNDYDVRLQANTSTPCIITLPTAAGTLARTNDNVASATKLQTPRTINGTNFDGSANITTANWGTARTLTIGNKGQSVNGSGNITWSTGDILGNTTSLGKDSDWNTANTTGIYEASGFNEEGATGANRPVGAYSWGGVLTLRHKNVTNQIYLSHGSNQMWIRGGWNGSFNTSWARVYTTDYKPTYSDVGAAASSHGTHVTWSTTTPKANGTATVGSETKVARGDHVHPLQTSVSGNAGTATKLATARTLTIGNTGKTFDGSANVSWTLSEIGASAEGHTHSSVASANVLNSNTKMDYGWNGLNYFNINGTAGNAAKANDTPTTAWWHIIRCNHANSAGYYTDIAVPFNATSMYYKRITGGAVQNSGWVKMLDALNFNEYAAAKSHGTHVTYATAAPKANGTAAIGSVNRVAREDHVHPLQTSVSGNAGTATKLQTARKITIGNASQNFDGSGNVSFTLSSIGAAGKYSMPSSTAAVSYVPLITFADAGSGNIHAEALLAGIGDYGGDAHAIALIRVSGRNNRRVEMIKMVPNSNGTVEIGYTRDETNKTTTVYLKRATYDGIGYLTVLSEIGAAFNTTFTSSTTAPTGYTAGSNQSMYSTLNPQVNITGNAATSTKLATARNIKIGNATKSFNGTANIEFTLADIGIGSSISAVASNLSGVTINGYDSMMTTINSNLGNL